MYINRPVHSRLEHAIANDRETATLSRVIAVPIAVQWSVVDRSSVGAVTVGAHALSRLGLSTIIWDKGTTQVTM